MGAWKDVSRPHPCHVCGRPDWCTYTLDGVWARCNRLYVAGGIPRVDKREQPYWLYLLTGSNEDHLPSLPEDPKRHTRLSDDVLSAFYTEFLRQLPLMDLDANNLRGRGLTDEEIALRGYKSIRTCSEERQTISRLLARTFGQDVIADVPGFLEMGHGTGLWTFGGARGFLIPSRDVQGRILGMQIRGDALRYSWLSSAKWKGPQAYAIAHVPVMRGKPDGTVVLTEGPLKGDIATALTGRLHVAVPGVSHYRNALSAIRGLGATKIQIAFDIDASEQTRKRIERIREEAARDFLAEGYQVEILTWDRGIGKGVDDLAHARGRVYAVEPRTYFMEGFNVSDFEEGLLHPPVPPKDEDSAERIGEKWFDDLLHRIEESDDIGLAHTPDAIRMLMGLRTMRAAWARAKKALKKAGVDMRDLERDFKEAEVAAKRRATQETMAEPGMDPMEGSTLDRMRLGDDSVIVKDGVYYLEKWRIDQQTNTPYVCDHVRLTNWRLEILRAVALDDQDKVSYDCHIYCGAKRADAQLDDEVLSDYRLMDRAVLRAFSQAITSPKYAKTVTMAVRYFNRGAKRLTGTNSLGYIDGRTYIMPSVMIRDGIAKENQEHPVIFESELTKRYDFRMGGHEEALLATHFLLTTCLDMHDRCITLPLLAACVAAPTIRRLKWQMGTLYIEGDLAEGKTLPCRVFANLFADIPLEGRGGLISAISTGNSMEKELYHLRDTVAIVDDIKAETVDGGFKNIFRMLQSITDGSGRGRMTTRTFAPRAQVIATGEDIPGTVASTISRILITRPPKGKLNLDEIQKIDANRDSLRTIMPRYIAWTQRQGHAIGSFDAIELKIRGGRTEAFARQFLAALRNFFAFLKEEWSFWSEPDNAMYLDSLLDEARTVFGTICENTQVRIQAERKEELFIQALREALAAGRACIGDRRATDCPSVGLYWLTQEEGERHLFIDLFPNSCVEIASKITPARFSTQSLGELLRDTGYLAATRGDRRPTIKRKADGLEYYVWRVPAHLLISRSEIEYMMGQVKVSRG